MFCPADGGGVVPSTTNAADGACGRGRLRRKKNKRPTTAATATAPPATPPAMAPVFDLLPEDEVGVGDGEEEVGEEGVDPDREAVEVVELSFPEAEVPVPVPVPINEPGCISGVSPTTNAVVAFQRFSLV